MSQKTKEVIDDDSTSNVATVGDDLPSGVKVATRKRASDNPNVLPTIDDHNPFLAVEPKKQKNDAGTPTSTTSTTTGGSAFDILDLRDLA